MRDMKNPELIFSIRYYNPDWIQLGCAKGRIVSPLVQRFLCLCENMMSQGSQREVWQGCHTDYLCQDPGKPLATPLKSTCRQRKVCLVNTCNEGLLLG